MTTLEKKKVKPQYAWTEAEDATRSSRRRGFQRGSTLKHKYNAKAAEADGLRFDSKKERNYYLRLKADRDVLFFLRQVPFDLPGGAKYRADFMVFLVSGEVKIIDVKGFRTETYKLKKRLVESLYPVTIDEV